jgi:hypothetical protein
VKWIVGACIIGFFLWAEGLGGNLYTTLSLSRFVIVLTVGFTFLPMTVFAWSKRYAFSTAAQTPPGNTPSHRQLALLDRLAASALAGIAVSWVAISVVKIVAQHLDGALSSVPASVLDVTERVSLRMRCVESVLLEFGDGTTKRVCYWHRAKGPLTTDGRRLRVDQEVLVTRKTNSLGIVLMQIEVRS